MFTTVHHVGYQVQDLDSTVAWYQEIFGAIYSGGDAAGAGKIGFVQIGGVEVELIEPADKAGLQGQDGPVFHHVGYVVEDLDTAVSDFKAKGYKFASEEPFTNVMGYRLIFFDTASTRGTRIHLTEASSLKRGA